MRARSGGTLDRMEDQASTFFHAVRQGFLNLAESDPKRIQVIDASQTVEAMQSMILSAVKDLIGGLAARREMQNAACAVPLSFQKCTILQLIILIHYI